MESDMKLNPTNKSRTSNEKGKYSELLAMTALLANGYSVLEPISPQPYDIAVRHPETSETSYVQVKSAFERDEERYGAKYLVVRGGRSNGKTYLLNEVDYFVAVWDSEVYMFPNREKSEYWVKTENVSKRWTKLSMEI